MQSAKIGQIRSAINTWTVRQNIFHQGNFAKNLRQVSLAVDLVHQKRLMNVRVRVIVGMKLGFRQKKQWLQTLTVTIR